MMSATFILFYYLDIILYENFLPFPCLLFCHLLDKKKKTTLSRISINHVFCHVAPVDLAHPQLFIIGVIQGYTYTQNTQSGADVSEKHSRFMMAGFIGLQ